MMRVMIEAGAKCPTRAHPNDAGLDLYAMHGGCVKAGQTATFHTGIHVELPEGTAGVILPKSGLMTKQDILAFGVIDEPYRGEILVHMFNLGHEDYNVMAGDKLTQMLVLGVRYEELEIVDQLSDTDRGNSGFGSTGRQ